MLPVTPHHFNTESSSKKGADATLRVIVVEPDSTYAEAATLKASGGVRQLFTQRENILLSQYTLQVLNDTGRTSGALSGTGMPGSRRRGVVAGGRLAGPVQLHALGMGRGLAELIVHGAYQTIDLDPFGYQRVLDQAAVAERGDR
jgi:hypothetical protein